MSSDRYANEALSELLDAPNIYPVGGNGGDFQLRSPIEGPITRRNIPSSPVNRFDFDDYGDYDEDMVRGPKNDDNLYYSDEESDYGNEFTLTSPVRRETNFLEPSVPPPVIPLGNGASSSITRGSTRDSRGNRPSRASRISTFDTRSSALDNFANTPSAPMSNLNRISNTPIPSPSPEIYPIRSSAGFRDRNSNTAPKISRGADVPVSQASRMSSPRSILFPPDGPGSKMEKTTGAMDDLLISNGYTPVKTIVVDNAIGKSDFILAVNKRGQYVLVSLNGKGKGLEGEIVHTEIINNSSSIPYSSKRGAFECANGVCGVAYDGEKELNIVTRDEFSMEPMSDTLVYKGENVASIGNNIPIPVISYNDIVHEPIAVLKNSYEITNRLHRHEYENCKAGMVEVSTEFKELESTLQSYMLLEIASARALAKSTVELGNYAGQYERDPPEDEKEKENYKMVKYNLRKRSDLFITLINCCGKISGMKNTLAELNQTIRELHELCEREFTGVERVMSP